MEPQEEYPDNYSPGETPIEAECPPEFAGMRLDQALARLFPRYSRSRLQEWIKAGFLSIDDEPVTETRRKLKGGETLLLCPRLEARDLPAEPEAIRLDIRYQDSNLLIINKPAGLVVHPGSGNWRGTMLNALLHYDPALVHIPRAGIVHRLDKDTSGLLVVARTLTAQTHLIRQLQEHSVKREYLAVAMGEVRRNAHIEAPIGRHPACRTKMAVTGRGKPAITHYRVERRFSGATLLLCRLETGRTHQIRTHLAHIGHPLLGDTVYGRARPNLPTFPRQALHASRLTLQHPVTGEILCFESALPDDMTNLLLELEAMRDER
ncbi:MAG: 23S rRNA pseudouridine(1911/1915/1917) synthase RluD [Betaproteobacteria bacterium]|nr:23S rRNA pseudouridine(1911/1915/1917) synthase RluD [Betaproteobacteria bacterium]